MLDPQAQALMKLMLDKGVPPVNTMTAVEARESYRSRRAFTQPDAPEVFKTEDQVASYFDVNVPVRVYRPFSSQSQKSLPALVYIHGGGWTIGDLDTHDVLCRSLCLQADIVVISVDYRMGPEHKFPAAYNDTVAAFIWTATNAVSLGIDPSRIAIGGDSAGGNLSAAPVLDCAIKLAQLCNRLFNCSSTLPPSCGQTPPPSMPMAKATCSPKSQSRITPTTI